MISLYNGLEVVTEENFEIGRKVVRGPDWKWGDQDLGKIGVIIGKGSMEDWARVDWTGKEHDRNTYRIRDFYDLCYFDSPIINDEKLFFSMKICGQIYRLKGSV